MRHLTTLLLAVVACHAQQCVGTYRFTNQTGVVTDGSAFITIAAGVASTPAFDNRQQACTGWIMTTSTFGLTAESVVFQSAPDSNGLPGTWATFAGTTVSGSNPSTAITQSTYAATGHFPFVRVNLASSTGTGYVVVNIQGWKSINYVASLGPTTAAAIVALFSSCSGTQYLGADGACHTNTGVPGGLSGQVEYNNAGAFGGMTGTSWDSTNRALSFQDSNNKEIFFFTSNPLGGGNCGNRFFTTDCGNISPADIGTSPGSTAGDIEITAPFGGNTTIVTTGIGGDGGQVNFTSGDGGTAANANTASTGGRGAVISLSSGFGGAATGTGTNVGGRANGIGITAGNGGNTSGGTSNTGGDGGDISLLNGSGGTGGTANGNDGITIVVGGAIANSDIQEWQLFAGTVVSKITATGGFQTLSYATNTNCADPAGAAACGTAAAGAFVIDAATTSTVVSTTRVTANSEIFLQEDSSLGARLGITCNTQSILVLGAPVVTARTAGASFTASIVVGPTATPMCLTYHIVN